MAPGQRGQVQGHEGERADGTWAPAAGQRGRSLPETPLPTTDDPSDNADSGHGKKRLQTVRGRAGVHMQSSLPEGPSPEHPLPQPVSCPGLQREKNVPSTPHHGHTCPSDLSFRKCCLAAEGLKSFPVAPNPALSYPLRDLSGSPIRLQVYLSFVKRQLSQEPLGCSIILQLSRQTTWKEAISPWLSDPASAPIRP